MKKLNEWIENNFESLTLEDIRKYTDYEDNYKFLLKADDELINILKPLSIEDLAEIRKQRDWLYNTGWIRIQKLKKFYDNREIICHEASNFFHALYKINQLEMQYIDAPKSIKFVK